MSKNKRETDADLRKLVDDASAPTEDERKFAKRLDCAAKLLAKLRGKQRDE